MCAMVEILEKTFRSWIVRGVVIIGAILMIAMCANPGISSLPDIGLLFITICILFFSKYRKRPVRVKDCTGVCFGKARINK